MCGAPSTTGLSVLRTSSFKDGSFILVQRGPKTRRTPDLPTFIKPLSRSTLHPKHLNFSVNEGVPGYYGPTPHPPPLPLPLPLLNPTPPSRRVESRDRPKRGTLRCVTGTGTRSKKTKWRKERRAPGSCRSVKKSLISLLSSDVRCD